MCVCLDLWILQEYMKDDENAATLYTTDQGLH